MTDPSGLDECDNCGAVLPPVDGEGRRTCLYCNASYGPETRRTPPTPPPAATPPPGAPRTDGIVLGTAPAATTGRGCLGSWILLIVVISIALPVGILVFVNGALDDAFDGLDSATGAGGGRRISGETALVLPGEPGAPADVVALTSRYDSASSSSVSELARYDGGTEPVWVGPPLGESAYQVPLLTDGTQVLTVDGAEAVALGLADGAERWRTPLSDVVSTSCEACTSVVADRFLVTTDDGVLHALELSTGAVAWERRFEDVRAPTYAVGDAALVIDGAGGEHRALLLGAVDGAELATFSPDCADPTSPAGFGDGVDADTQVLAQPDGSVVLAYGTWPGCVDRWDPATGARRWQALLPEASFSTDLRIVADGTTLVTQDGEGGLAAIDLASGTLRPLPPEPDRELVPVAVGAEGVTALASTTRGSDRWEVVQLDPGTGTTRWVHELGDVTPTLDGFGASTIVSGNEVHVAVGVDATGVHLVAFDGATGDLTVERLDPATGAADGPRTVALAHDPGSQRYLDLAWPPGRAVLLVDDTVVVLDLATATVADRYGT